jgi:hypothetical protein
MASNVPAGDSVFKELRDEARRAVSEVPVERVYCKDRSHRQLVRAIRDFSARGISLCLDDPLTPGEPVVIELTRGDRPLTFYAYVAWCRFNEVPSDGSAPLSGRCIAGLRVYGTGSLAQLLAH